MFKRSGAFSRILCIVAPLGDPKSKKLKLHLMKVQGENFELSKTYKAKLLQSVAHSKSLWELKFYGGKTLRIADTSPQMEAFLTKLVSMCKEFCGTNPTMGAGAPKTFYEAMSDDSVSSEELRDFDPTEFRGAEEQEEEEALDAGEHREAHAGLLTPEEEANLLAALGMWDAGAGAGSEAVDVVQLVAVLQREQAGLQALNARAVMEAEDVYVKLQQDLASTAVLLGDMEHTLQQWDGTLAKLSRDIEVVQEQNSDLEITRAHHFAIEKEIRALVASLTLDSRHLPVLQQGPFDPKSQLMLVLDSADALEALMDKAIKDPLKMGLKSVRERLQHYSGLRGSFLNRLSAHLESQFQSLGLELQGPKHRHRYSRKRFLAWLVHSEVFEAFWPFSPLMRLLKENAFPQYVAVQRKYATAMQPVYRKEIMNYFTVAKSFIETSKSRKETVLLGSTNQAQSLNLLVASQSNRLPGGLTPSAAGGGAPGLGPGRGLGVPGQHSRTPSVFSDEMTDVTYSHRPNPPPRLPMYKPAAVRDSASVISTLDGDTKQRPDRAFANFLCTTANVVAREHEFCASFFHLTDDGQLTAILQELLTHQETGPQQCALSVELATILKWMQKNCDQLYFLPCLSVISAVKEEYAGKCAYVLRLVEQVEPTAQQILADFVRDQVESISSCHLHLKHSFVAPYFAKFPLFCDRIEALSAEMYCPRAAAVMAVYAQFAEAMFAALEQQVDPGHKLAAFYKFKNYAFFHHRAEAFLPAGAANTGTGADEEDAMTAASAAPLERRTAAMSSRSLTPQPAAGAAKSDEASFRGHNRSLSEASDASDADTSTGFDDASRTESAAPRAAPNPPVAVWLRQETLAMSRNAAQERLQQCCRLATRRMQDYEQQYLHSLFKKSFRELHSFISGVSALLRSYEPREVPFQERYSTAVVAQMVEGLTPKALREGLEDMAARVRKHFFKQSTEHRAALRRNSGPSDAGLGDNSESFLGVAVSDDEFRQYLYTRVWHQLLAHVAQSYQRLRTILASCYPRLQLGLSERELDSILQQVRGRR
eukprot:EG_transcript_1118